MQLSLSPESGPRPFELPSSQRETFSEWFPDGRIEVVADPATIPEAAMKLFEGYSKRFLLPEDYQPGNFEGFG